MKKLTILFALLTLSVGLWAETQTVNYIDANGKQQTAATATVVTNSSSQVTWGTAGQTTWYIVTGTGVFNTLGIKQAGQAIRIVGKDGKTIKFFNMEKVEFIKEETNK